MAPECQQKNAKGLTIAVVGMNKAAEEFVILDEATKADLASGRYHDQRRGSFGTSTAEPGGANRCRTRGTGNCRTGGPGWSGHRARPAPGPEESPAAAAPAGEYRRPASRGAESRRSSRSFTTSKASGQPR